MSLNRTLRSAHQLEHASQYTDGHKRDKLIGEQRRADHWLLVPGPRKQPSRDFRQVKVRDFIRNDEGTLVAATATEYVDHLKRAAADNRYVAPKKRGKTVGTSVRTCKSPITELTVTLSPASSEYLAIGARKNPERVAEILEELLTLMAPEVEVATGAQIVGMTVHTDTDNVHLNFVVSRIARDRDGVRRLKTKRGWGTVGAWMVGVDRQRRAGVVYKPHDDVFAAALERFLQRGKPALDLILAQALDALCLKMLPGLCHFIKAYAEQVSARRRDAVKSKSDELRAQLAALEKAGRSISSYETSNSIYKTGVDR